MGLGYLHFSGEFAVGKLVGATHHGIGQKGEIFGGSRCRQVTEITVAFQARVIQFEVGRDFRFTAIGGKIGARFPDET